MHKMPKTTHKLACLNKNCCVPMTVYDNDNNVVCRTVLIIFALVLQIIITAQVMSVGGNRWRNSP